jgi:lipid-binding SYLF domain-containing protein
VEAATAVEIDAKADAALESFLSSAPMGKELIEKSIGILIFPAIVKAGLILGGEYGEGVLKTEGKSVEYYSTTSGSIGLQIGMQQKSVIIMFMEQTALDSFRKADGWQFGVDGSVVVIDLGAGGGVSTSTMQQPVIGFIFNQKGFMGNLSLEGTKLSKIIR